MFSALYTEKSCPKNRNVKPSDLDVQIPTVGPALIQDHVQGNIISMPVNILKINFIKKFTTFIFLKSLKHKI